MIEKLDYPSFNPRGLIKIELFDELTGKKKEEIKTHNFISIGFKNHLMKLAMKSLFTNYRNTGGVNFYDNIKDPFNCMYLTDASHSEQPNSEWLIKGRRIGYAYTNGTYSGPSTMRGSYNATESFTRLDQVRIVVDFPTHAANGSFQSIYFTYDGSKFSNTSYFSKFGVYVVKVKKYGNYIYALTNSSTSSSTFNKYDLNYNLIETYNLPESKTDFEIYNDYIYFSSNSTSRAVQRATLSNPTSLTTIVTGYNAGGICFDVAKNQFIVVSSTSNSGSGRVSIHKYDINFNLLSTNETNYTNSYNSIKTTYDNGDIIIDDQILIGNDYLTFAGIHECRGIIDDEMVLSDGAVIPKIGISSRALLDSPVTKTSNSTMKITYDFILE